METATGVTVEVKPGGYALVTMAREPVNTLDMGMWRQLLSALDDLEADGAVRGVIFSSGLSRDVFTAGNDIKELYAPMTSLEVRRDTAGSCAWAFAERG
jgi:Delta3-Delta2-enoyl-CoA isomerase